MPLSTPPAFVVPNRPVRVLVSSREMRALGVVSAYAVDELVGADRASADPAGSLAELAERVARTWSR
jgi:glycerate kinase